MKDLAREIVAELEPSEGWWKTDTENELVSIAETLLEVMCADDVQDVMDDMIRTMRSEYGE